MSNDWRLTNQMKYLRGVTLQYATFISREAGDHAHCEFCWKKFDERNAVEQKGYSTLDKYYWICPQCFSDFRSQFEWVLENPVDGF